jgi:hypothetical protein
MAIGVKGNGLGVLKDLVRTDIKFVACDRVTGFAEKILGAVVMTVVQPSSKTRR